MNPDEEECVFIGLRRDEIQIQAQFDIGQNLSILRA
jgi:hypothetical protein